MVHCHICNQKIGYLGWPNHVKMEKRIHGQDIYKLFSQMRTEMGTEDYLIWKNVFLNSVDEEQKTIDEYKEMVRE